jgi:maltoporin
MVDGRVQYGLYGLWPWLFRECFQHRPVLRAFLTYASWSDGFRGLVGGAPYFDRTNGLTYGVQAETWW